MKRLMTMVAIALTVALTGSAFAATGDRVVTKMTIVTAADQSVFTNMIELCAGSAYRSIEGIRIDNNSTSTATSVITLADVGKSGAVAYLALATYTNATTVVVNNYPLRAGAWVDTSTTNTPPTPFIAQKLRVITTLSATNVVVSSVDFFVYGKE